MNQASTAPTLSRQAWQQYRSNLPRHVIGLTRDLQSRLMHTLIKERGHSGLGLHFEPYISLAGTSGIRLSELADALSISKQAVNQAVNQIEKAGYLRREPDPEDGRAKRAVLTDRGQQLLTDGALLLGTVEAEFSEIVGKKTLAKFTGQLAELYQALGLEASSGARSTHRTRGGTTLGWLLPRISDKLRQELMELTRSRGHPGLKMSYGQILTLMTPDGGRIQEMARINEVSKQAISAIALELEDLGYLQRIADPADARQVILSFTTEGVHLMEDSIAATASLDRRILDALGARTLAFIKQTAETLYRELGLENDVFGSSGQDIDSLAGDIVRSLGKRNARLLAQRLIESTEN